MTRILDQNEVEFFLEKLSDCSLWDARRILNCQKKVLSERETAFLVAKDKLNLFQKSDYYIQKISLPQNLKSYEDDAFLIENVVAELFCNVADGDWWLYAAHRQSNLRIIAGIGRGIILSRFLPLDADVSDEISKTATYLQRFGMAESLKIFSPIQDIHPVARVNCEKFYIEDFDDAAIVKNFLSNNCKVKSIASSQTLNNKILYAILFILVLILFGLDKCVENKKETVLLLKKSVRIATKDMELEINDKNFSFIKQLVNTLGDSCNPVELFRKAAKICREHNIQIERLSFENGKQVKIKTSMSKSALEKLKSDRNIEIERNANEEYETLGSNKKIGVVLCVR